MKKNLLKSLQGGTLGGLSRDVKKIFSFFSCDYHVSVCRGPRVFITFIVGEVAGSVAEHQ
jgi:hypothetical protein